jgi:hypothetical protein
MEATYDDHSTKKDQKMAGAARGAIHLSKDHRHVAVLTIDVLGLMRGLGDDSDGVRLRQRRRLPTASKSRPASVRT